MGFYWIFGISLGFFEYLVSLGIFRDRVQSISRVYTILCESYTSESDKYRIYSDVFSFDTIQHKECYTSVNIDDSRRLTTTNIIYYTISGHGP